jgi:outer membrane protein TolC
VSATPANASTAPATQPDAAPTKTTGANISADTARKGRAWADAAAKRVELLEAASRVGTVSTAEIAAASRDWLRACRESGMRGDELIAATQKHLDRMTRTRDLVKSQNNNGQASSADVATAEAAVAEAEFYVSAAKDSR